MDEYFIVEAVVSLRREPIPAGPSFAHDDLTVTQLLFNERLRVRGRKEGWAFVEAVEQETFRSAGRWEGYPGWVEESTLARAPRLHTTETLTITSAFAPVLPGPTNDGVPMCDLSIGTRISVDASCRRDGPFFAIELASGRRGWVDSRHSREEGREAGVESRRRDILAAARLFLGTPYLWGGRSMHMPHVTSVATGVDCSGLVNLVFRTAGIDLPRDAHEQRMKTEPVPADSLEPGDLVFITLPSGETNHVMLYTGGDRFIEALESGTAVRERTFSERFGKALTDLSTWSGSKDGLTISFGRAPL